MEELIFPSFPITYEPVAAFTVADFSAALTVTALTSDKDTLPATIAIDSRMDAPLRMFFLNSLDSFLPFLNFEFMNLPPFCYIFIVFVYINVSLYAY